MNTPKSYENYPTGTVLIANSFTLAMYALGFLIILKLGLVFSLFYLLYVFILEYRLIKYHCTKCYYWGKTCGFGKGRLSSWFFRQGNPSEFCTKKLTWRNMIPDMLISLVPVIIGIILLILEFNIILLSALLLLVLLTTTGNSFIRGSLTCKYCRQRESGCPADALFNK